MSAATIVIIGSKKYLDFSIGVSVLLLQLILPPNASCHRSSKQHPFDQLTVCEVSWDMAVVQVAS
jgi:hypothetical protein